MMQVCMPGGHIPTYTTVCVLAGGGRGCGHGNLCLSLAKSTAPRPLLQWGEELVPFPSQGPLQGAVAPPGEAPASSQPGD